MSVCEFEVPPPGVALRTVMLRVPAVVRSEAGIVAVTCVLLTNVVVRFDPPTRTTESGRKFVPLTVRVNEASPTVLVVGRMLVVVEAGLLTEKLVVALPPPGVALFTVTVRDPVAAVAAMVIFAVSCVALLTVVEFTVMSALKSTVVTPVM